MPEAEPVIIATGWEVEEDMVYQVGSLGLNRIIDVSLS